MVLSGCSNIGRHSDERVANMINDLREHTSPYFSLGALFCYKEDGNTIIVFEDEAYLLHAAVFSGERKMRQSINLEVIADHDFSHIIGSRKEDMIKLLGAPLLDIGSGFEIQSYLTNNAVLVGFWIEDGMVAAYAEWDLFAGERIVNRNK